MAHELGVGTNVMLHFLKKHGYNPCKTTKAPGLDEKLMAQRTEFCKRYKY
jgi:hypothetical protein